MKRWNKFGKVDGAVSKILKSFVTRSTVGSLTGVVGIVPHFMGAVVLFSTHDLA
jgi:hypothetical protein